MPWKPRQQRAVAAEKHREAKRKGMSDKEADAYVSKFMREHGHGESTKDKAKRAMRRSKD